MGRADSARRHLAASAASFIVELDLPRTTVRMHRVEPAHAKVTARAYRPEIEPVDESARRAALEEARLAVRAILGREPLTLDAGDALIVEATPDEVARIRTVSRVRNVIPNQALRGAR